MKKFILDIKKYFKYSIRSAKAELNSEVAGSYLNWLWWIIEPLCFMIIYTIVFGMIFSNTQEYFSSFVFMGIVFWDFFNRMISGSVKLIPNNSDLVTKVYIPKYILLFSKSLTYLFKMFICLLLAIALMIFQNVQFSLNLLFIIPIIIVFYLLSFGIGMIVMHFGVYINDLSNLTTIGLRVVFYLSGVFYNLNSKLTGSLKYILLRINPVAFLMNEARKVSLYCKCPSFEGLLFWLIISLILCFIGLKLIIKNENTYAKVI